MAWERINMSKSVKFHLILDLIRVPKKDNADMKNKLMKFRERSTSKENQQPEGKNARK